MQSWKGEEMQELIRNAMNGWLRYTEAGKYAVLLLGLLLWTGYLQYLKKNGENKSMQQEDVLRQRIFWWYAAVMTGMAICPVTAALWMEYQTRFYDYEWIWSAVPVTGFIAVSASGLFFGYQKQLAQAGKWKTVGAILCAAVVLWLCGSMGVSSVQGMWTIRDMQNGQGTQDGWIADTIDILEDSYEELTGSGEGLCVWAPSEILTHIRERNGHIRLLYGRNMWENALKGYSYDTYDPEVIALYEWMEQLSAAVKEETMLPIADSGEVLQKLKSANARGVNSIVFHGECTDIWKWSEGRAEIDGLWMHIQQTERVTICFLIKPEQ